MDNSVITAGLQDTGLTTTLLVLLRRAHSTNKPTATDEKKNALLYISVVTSLVGAVSGNH